MPLSPLTLALLSFSPLTASAPGPDGVRTLDLSGGPTRAATATATASPEGVPFESLDDYTTDAVHPTPDELPHGWARSGPDTLQSNEGDPEAIFAVEDIPGNAYPRKATLYMNFVGGDMLVGKDNSAINKSTLSKGGAYPMFTGGEQTAVAAAQEMANDVAAFGIQVVYDQRPGPIAPYTMAMIGGNWTDTTLEDGASGVAPGADCGALGQRHVVYVFAAGNWGPAAIANVTAQEAGHAWGLDHTVNCNSVMSYCGGGNKNFSGNCDPLCEGACQGPAGCRLFHEQFCGVGNDRQDEVAELMFLFGGPEPDLQAPVVEIVSPAEDITVEPGTDIAFRAAVDDDYGGFGWKFVIAHDGEVVYDEIDFERDIDENYLAGLNLDALEPGVYDLGIVAEDQHGNVGTDMVRVTVQAGAGGDDGGGDDGGADDGAAGDDGAADGGAGGDGSGGDGGTDPTGHDPELDGDEFGGNGVDDGGCSCRSGRTAPVTAGWSLMLWGLVLAPRRARRDRRSPARA
jgi:hypothetical protein